MPLVLCFSKSVQLALFLSHVPEQTCNPLLSVRVVELGPRLTLKLVKVEEGLMGGEVMFHAFVERSPEEVERLRERRLQLK